MTLEAVENEVLDRSLSTAAAGRLVIMREGEAFGLQVAGSPMHGLRPPPMWWKQARAPEPVELLSVRRVGVRQKRGLLATFQQREQQKLADHTLQEAERALRAKEFELAFELFTRVLLQSAVAAEAAVPGAAAAHAEAQRGARRARIGMSSEGDCQNLLLEAADDTSNAGCNVSFASPPVDLPDSPVVIRSSTPAVHHDVEIEAASRATASVPVRFSNQRSSRRRELFAPKATKYASSTSLIVANEKQTSGKNPPEDNKQRRVTVLSTPRTELALLESLDNLLASLSNSFLATRCWRTGAGQEVILRHYPNRCDISIDGGLSWRSRKHSFAHFFLTPSQPIVLPLALMPAVEDEYSSKKALRPQQAAIRIRRSRHGVGNRDYSLAQWNSHGSEITPPGTVIETVVVPVLVGAAGHCAAASVSRSFRRMVPQVRSIEVCSFAVLEDRVYGGHYAVYRLRTSIALPTKMLPGENNNKANALEGFDSEVVVERRFSEFQRLHELVASCYNGTCYTVPALPPKTWMLRRFDLPFLVDRKRRLQHYLQGLLLLPGVAENIDLRAFLVPNYGNQAGTRLQQSLLHNQQTDEI